MDVVKRLHSQTIAGNEQLLFALIPDGKRKHAAQIIDASRAVLFVKMKDCFSVAVGVVDVALCFERLAIIGVVVDLTVVGDVQRTQSSFVIG